MRRRRRVRSVRLTAKRLATAGQLRLHGQPEAVRRAQHGGHDATHDAGGATGPHQRDPSRRAHEATGESRMRPLQFHTADATDEIGVQPLGILDRFLWLVPRTPAETMHIIAVCTRVGGGYIIIIIKRYPYIPHRIFDWIPY